MSDHSFSKDIFPNTQSKPPLTQLEAISSRPIKKRQNRMLEWKNGRQLPSGVLVRTFQWQMQILLSCSTNGISQIQCSSTQHISGFSFLVFVSFSPLCLMFRFFCLDFLCSFCLEVNMLSQESLNSNMPLFESYLFTV